MKVLVLDGRLDDSEMASVIEKSLIKHFSNHDVTWVRLLEKKIDPCLGCYSCWIKTPGLCAISDDANEIVRQMSQCDLLIELTPVTFGGYSSELKKILDRSIPNLLPFFRNFKGEVHHYQRYENVPSNLTIGYQDDPELGVRDIFENLAKRNVLNMTPPKSSCLVLDRQSNIDEKIAKSLKEVLP